MPGAPELMIVPRNGSAVMRGEMGTLVLHCLLARKVLYITNFLMWYLLVGARYDVGSVAWVGTLIIKVEVLLNGSSDEVWDGLACSVG